MKYAALSTILLSINFLCAMEEQEQQVIELNINNKLTHDVNMTFPPKKKSKKPPTFYLVPSKKIGTLTFQPQEENAELILSFAHGLWHFPINIESEKDSYSITVAENNNMIELTSGDYSSSFQNFYYNRISIGACNADFSSFTKFTIENKNLSKIILFREYLLKNTEKKTHKLHLVKKKSFNIETCSDYANISILLIIPQALKTIILNIDQAIIANDDILTILKEGTSDTINIIRKRKYESDLLVATLHYYGKEASATITL